MRSLLSAREKGGIMKDIIKKSWTTGYYMIYPKVQQKEKKQNI